MVITAECALCYTTTECIDDGEAYICVNRHACNMAVIGLALLCPEEEQCED